MKYEVLKTVHLLNQILRSSNHKLIPFWEWNSNDPVKAIQNIQEENNELKKQVESLLRDKAKALKAELRTEVENINGVNFLSKKVD